MLVCIEAWCHAGPLTHSQAKTGKKRNKIKIWHFFVEKLALYEEVGGWAHACTTVLSEGPDR